MSKFAFMDDDQTAPKPNENSNKYEGKHDEHDVFHHRGALGFKKGWYWSSKDKVGGPFNTSQTAHRDFFDHRRTVTQGNAKAYQEVTKDDPFSNRS